MNARAGLFLNRRSGRGALLASVGAGLLLSGCVSALHTETAIDPRSPIATEVARAARANTDYPSFSEIPAAPRDVRPIRMYGEAAHDILVAGSELEAATAPNTWSLQNSETFAERARAKAGPALPPPSASESEAYANSLRQRATPPPPPKR